MGCEFIHKCNDYPLKCSQCERNTGRSWFIQKVFNPKDFDTYEDYEDALPDGEDESTSSS